MLTHSVTARSAALVHTPIPRRSSAQLHNEARIRVHTSLQKARSRMACQAVLQEAAEEQCVTFMNEAQGLRISGTFLRSPTPTTSCVILCHGYAGTRDDMALPDIAQVQANNSCRTHASRVQG